MTVDLVKNTQLDNQVIEVAGRFAHAAVAFGVTYQLAGYIGVEHDAVKEVAILNGGLAYYTRDAAGRVTTALNALYAKLTAKGVTA